MAWQQADIMARKQGGNAEDYLEICYDSLLEIDNDHAI